MTGLEFMLKIDEDPSWCLSIKEPLEITTYVQLIKEAITHLSPFLTFSGKNEMGWAADFERCKNLKVATGTFHGFVYFGSSGIKEIKNLNITGIDSEGDSANFYSCKNLKVATGTFKGAVNFESSKIEEIKELIIQNKNIKKEKASFIFCPIKYVPKKYREKGFGFNYGVIEKSIIKDRKDSIKHTVEKIKSETNNIEL